jgi:hypothetical protein
MSNNTYNPIKQLELYIKLYTNYGHCHLIPYNLSLLEVVMINNLFLYIVKMACSTSFFEGNSNIIFG